MPWYYILQYIVLSSIIIAASCLQCWNCLADDCHLDPSKNYKATKATCNDGESCQKVEYQARDSPSKTDYFSVVRSCSQGECVPHTDNCTDTLKTNPGCMVRHCCSGHSLCNGGERLRAGLGLLMGLLWVSWII